MTRPGAVSNASKGDVKSSEAGMSLIELMISMVVLSVGLLGSISLILLGMQNNSRGKTDTASTVLDQEILEKFSTLKTYPKPGGFINIYDCALTGANLHQASIAAGVAPAGAGADIYTASPPAPLPTQVGDIDWTQAAPALATSAAPGYDMTYRTCDGDVYEVRWNIMEISPNPNSRISLLTVSSRPRSAVAASGTSSNYAVLYANPTTLKALIEN
jgi:prepilin-type N-terminal cleavage/methylation domain-containing protein